VKESDLLGRIGRPQVERNLGIILEPFHRVSYLASQISIEVKEYTILL